ncbi:MAG: hypothetical protein GXO62_05295 [Epsilonproteobacteria bacterium]|nr:hypothetical protein [Campylobacterota bacterium]
MRFLLLCVTFLYSLNLPNSYSAKFLQKIKSTSGTLTYKGKIYYKKPYLLWIYTYPQEKKIWVKDKIYIYEPDLMQVTVAPKKITLNSILKHSKKIKNSLYVAKIKDTTYKFIFDKYLKKLSYTDPTGNKVSIEFFDFSDKVDDKLFNINYPKDTDVIYQIQ